MSKKVDLGRLGEALGDYGLAYLVTVDDGYHAHTTTVDPVVLSDGCLGVGPVGGRTGKNLANRSDVTLLWPPREPGGYSLIVDGRVESDGAGDTSRLRVAPTRAVLHRRAEPGSPTAATGCLHDCMVLAEA